MLNDAPAQPFWLDPVSSIPTCKSDNAYDCPGATSATGEPLNVATTPPADTTHDDPGDTKAKLAAVHPAPALVPLIVATTFVNPIEPGLTFFTLPPAKTTDPDPGNNDPAADPPDTTHADGAATDADPPPDPDTEKYAYPPTATTAAKASTATTTTTPLR
jgi:hypothetical protein